MKRLAALLPCFAFWFAHAAEPLPPLSADPQNLTVSGLSSGAFMAVQFHVAHSAQVHGAGVIAGGPYYCARGSMLRTLSCMSPSFFTPLPAPARLREEAEKQAAAGHIDPPSELQGSRVWLLTGGHDTVVKSSVIEAVRAFYLQWLPEPDIALERLDAAAHAMISPLATNDCGTLQPPFINRCGRYDAPGRLLSHLLGPLQPRAQSATGKLAAFDQSGFAPEKAGMADTGYVYIPTPCLAGGCRVHISFHGCRQNATTAGEAWVRQSGYNEWADTNRLIVLYPQTSNAQNADGCWDWWGYSGPDYHTRNAPQIKAVWEMVERLRARP